MRAVGCLWIDELTVGKRTSSDRRLFWSLDGVTVRRFEYGGGEGLWTALQTALQRVREAFGAATVAARGSGCAAALALAAQLPVERLALIAPARPERPGAGEDMTLYRQARRLERFARRNLSLCACDILAVARANDTAVRALRAGGLCAHSRVTWLRVDGDLGPEVFTNREYFVNQALSGFLRTGELPKSLAENREMCIIYG